MSKPLRYLLAVLLPPVGVFLTYGLSISLLISIVLTLLGWLPGSMYAVWALVKHDENVGETT
ncbi:YqaE/Pmp3 family membrane protein [Leptothoe sp. PORK10 BA2]|uniref:YqaE/Pmp3 family membrane protein n=1 Tax=Leptothoe sp. PORK10 BA2 TaxID=3110254 RepID=UPI002B1F3BF4|nr:YqaE/Pmp3 family membrane protein [Leptothoe sp. PORK10 BA2]MEA5465974.1 YqaE/Pmp3 family membrane protein [Leptothoe sp. PORK10 BA2]